MPHATADLCLCSILSKVLRCFLTLEIIVAASVEESESRKSVPDLRHCIVEALAKLSTAKHDFALLSCIHLSRVFFLSSPSVTFILSFLLAFYPILPSRFFPSLPLALDLAFPFHSVPVLPSFSFFPSFLVHGDGPVWISNPDSSALCILVGSGVLN